MDKMVKNGFIAKDPPGRLAGVQRFFLFSQLQRQSSTAGRQAERPIRRGKQIKDERG
jgi:hypothetical protein